MAKKALDPTFRLLLPSLVTEMGKSCIGNNHFAITQVGRRHLFRQIIPTSIIPKSEREQFLETNSLIQTSWEVCENYSNVPNGTPVSSENHIPNKIPN